LLDTKHSSLRGETPKQSSAGLAGVYKATVMLIVTVFLDCHAAAQFAKMAVVEWAAAVTSHPSSL
jgi:hypothetical protein